MIEGELVVLRPHETRDLDRYYAWFNDPEVTLYLNMRYPISRLAEEAWLADRTSSSLAYGDVALAIDTKDGRHIGSVAFHRTSPEDRTARLGITIGDKTHWSKGYGTDAIRTLVRFGFEEMNLNRIDLTVDERNARAIACYRKCGFVEEARLRQDRYAQGAYHDTLVMALLRAEWPGWSADREPR